MIEWIPWEYEACGWRKYDGVLLVWHGAKRGASARRDGVRGVAIDDLWNPILHFHAFLILVKKMRSQTGLLVNHPYPLQQSIRGPRDVRPILITVVMQSVYQKSAANAETSHNQGHWAG
jgi:hypothetical protein